MTVVTQETVASTSFPALGSEITVAVTEPARLDQVVGHVRACVDLVDRTLSRFRPDSELRRLERRPGEPQPASALFIEALERSIMAAAASNGLFDPTIRDALEAAGYDRSIERIEAEGPGPARLPRPGGGWTGIRVDRANRTVTLPPGVRLDFGGIGKGLLVDLALRTLGNLTCGMLVSAGGDLAVTGPPPQGGWRCGIALTPDAPDEAVVRLTAGALATSGLGRRQWTREGQVLHHLIDPRTGRPGVSRWQVVTVAAGSCVVAEVAAKVAWLLDDDGPAWVARRGLAGRFRDRAGAVVTVGGWPAETSAGEGA
ncbi:FAD:protein FMN transferase [Sphaerobacter thermophilus]|uniref:FAD:protein FMN transferase n=1 Tax=Sphaerobacter thermophilus TaxID=2057 RepID=UPI0039C2C77A